MKRHALGFVPGTGENGYISVLPAFRATPHGLMAQDVFEYG